MVNQRITYRDVFSARACLLVSGHVERQRYISSADGLRAISVLLVVTWHDQDPLWLPWRGYLGVTTFFLLSGFIITRLLLQEERSSGGVSLAAFFVRRAFRILPLYYVALATFSVLVLGLGLGTAPETYPGRLFYFLTYLNEFAPAGTFGHSWSLGVEEKFYLLWPLLAFVVPFARRARTAVSVAVLLLCAVSAVTPWPYPSLYVPIACGCLLAVLEPRLGPLTRLAGTSAGFVAALAVAVLAGMHSPWASHTQVLYSVAASPLLLAVIAARGVVAVVLGRGLLAWIGRRSYAVYLFHPIVLSAVDLVQPASASPLVAVMRFLAVTAGSLVVAEALYWSVERPCILKGRALSARIRAGQLDRHGRTADGISATV